MYRCDHASFASDMWSIGVILYMMVSGGLSPFWDRTEYRTQRMILRGQLANSGFRYKRAFRNLLKRNRSLNFFTHIFNSQPNFKDVSNSAIDCISHLLVVNPAKRLTPSQCLEHRWLTTAYLDTLKNLETMWIRKYLARR